MKKGKIFSAVAVMSVCAAMLCSCGKKASGADNSKPLTLEIYDVAANYQGMQTGWFAKIVKDKFNIELNIIAPQVAGDSIYQLRASSGNLGDIVLLESTQFKDCLEAGLIKDISSEIKNCPNLMKFDDQISTFNKGLPGNSAGKYYGIPTEMTDTSPTTVTQERVYSLPQLKWDLYNKIGAPELNNLDDLLKAFVEMRKIHPTNANGDPAYPLSLWPDWDGGDGMIGIANVVQLTTWYGEKIKGSAFCFIPVKDQHYYADSDTYYGSGRVFGVGSKVDAAKYKRIMEFLDWYASPEALTIEHAGLKGFNYEVGADGKYIQINDNALMDNLLVPAEFGGGGYSDGNNAINQWIAASTCINPETKETYVFNYWKSYKEKNMTQMRRDWEKKYNADNATDYMVKNNVLVVSPSVSVSLESDSADISVIRNSVNHAVCDASWRMIFAADDKAFDKMWDEMVTELKGFGFDDLYKFDVEKHTIEVNAKLAALK